MTFPQKSFSFKMQDKPLIHLQKWITDYTSLIPLSVPMDRRWPFNLVLSVRDLSGVFCLCRGHTEVAIKGSKCDAMSARTRIHQVRNEHLASNRLHLPSATLSEPWRKKQ